MFAICARIVPNAGLRVTGWPETSSALPAPSTVVPVRMKWDNSALGPFTFTAPSTTETVTPAGIGTGILPIRDMAPSLPDLREELATQAGLPRFAIGQETPRSAHDRPTEAAPDARDARLADGGTAPE